MSLRRFMKPIVTADTTEKLSSIARKMKDARVGCVIVTLEGRPYGIVTDRDVVIRGLARDDDRGPESLVATDVVTYDPIVLQETDEIETAARTMRERGVRRLPIVDSDGRVTGIITADDLTAFLGQELADLASGVAENIDADDAR